MDKLYPTQKGQNLTVYPLGKTARFHWPVTR